VANPKIAWGYPIAAAAIVAGIVLLIVRRSRRQK